jgi:hypothetical protein
MKSVFRHMKRFWATESILDQKKYQKTHLEDRKPLPKLVPRGISKKMVDLTCTTDEHVCVISINCNKTVEFSATEDNWCSLILQYRLWSKSGFYALLISSCSAWWRSRTHAHSVSWWNMFSSHWIHELRITSTSWQKILLIHYVPLHDVKVGVWCVIGAARTTGCIFFGGPYVHTDVLHAFRFHFFNHLSNYERTLSLFSVRQWNGSNSN